MIFCAVLYSVPLRGWETLC